MRTNALLLAALASGALLAAVPARATHPWQQCDLNIDVAAVAKPVGGAKSATITFVYDRSSGGGAPESGAYVEIPTDGSSTVYKRTVISDLYSRSLGEVKIELRAGSSDSAPVSTVTLKPLNGDSVTDEKAKKQAPVVCFTYAD